jgi:hypothetical protein
MGASSQEFPQCKGAELSVSDFALAQHHPFQRGQPLEAHRPAGVELVGADADLGAQAVLEAVGQRVLALTMTLAESTSRKRCAWRWSVVRMASVWWLP